MFQNSLKHYATIISEKTQEFQNFKDFLEIFYKNVFNFF